MSMRFPGIVGTIALVAVSLWAPLEVAAATLTVEQAKELLAKSDPEAVLQVTGVTAVSPEVCSVLVGHATGVDLSVLKAIDEPLARVLAGCRGKLVLNGVGQISDQCAAILAECPGDLALSGLSELRSASLAKKLASQQSPTVLPRVTSLPLAVADALGAARSMPVLGDLEALESRLLARRLANRNGDDLTFSALRGLSPEAAAGLAEFPCDLRLPALTSLDVPVAQALGAHQGVLVIDKVQTMRPEALAALLKNRGTVGLSGLQTLGQPVPPEVLQAIRTHEGMLGLDGLRDLSPAVAKAMHDHRGAVTLTGLRRIAVDVAEHLVGSKGDVWIDNVTVADSYEEIKTLLRHRGPGRIILPEELHALPRELVVAIEKNSFLCLANTLGCGPPVRWP